jgi:hypothetical protein
VFTLNNDNQVVLTISDQTPMPPNAESVFQALKQSEYVNCLVLTENVNKAFRNSDFEQVVVAEKHDATLSIIISDDKMVATATLTTAYGGVALSLEKAMKQIALSNVNEGVIPNQVKVLLKQQLESLPGKKISAPIARGKEAIAGKDGYLEKHVLTLSDRLNQPKLNPDGSVDMRDFGALASVQAGDKLMTQHFPTIGKDGFNVNGKTLKARSGNHVKLIASDGTALEGSANECLIATITGVPVDAKQSIRVDDVFTIKNVDVKSGHIKFDGSVVITKDIEPGMKVTAKGDITVLGSVQSADLNATGNIEIKEGCIGYLKESEELSNKIVCHGNLNVAHAQYTSLTGNQVLIKNQAHHCDVKAKNELIIGDSEHSKGKFIGGRVLDAKIMICGEIGTEKGAPVEISLGNSGLLLKNRTTQVFEVVRECKQRLENLKDEFNRALSIEDAEQQQALLIDISEQQNKNEQLVEFLPNKAARFDQAARLLRDYCFLEVHKTLHSNVTLHIFDKTFKTNRSYPPLKAKIASNKLEFDFKKT